VAAAHPILLTSSDSQAKTQPGELATALGNSSVTQLLYPDPGLPWKGHRQELKGGNCGREGDTRETTYGHCVPSNPWLNPGLLVLNSQSSCSSDEKSSPAAGSQTCSGFSAGEDYPIYSNRDSSGSNPAPSGSCQTRKVVSRKQQPGEGRSGEGTADKLHSQGPTER